MRTDWTSWVFVGLVLVASLNTFVQLNILRVLFDEDIGRRRRRRAARKMVGAMGWWELSVGTYMISQHSWANVVPLVGLGIGFIMWGRESAVWYPPFYG